MRRLSSIIVMLLLALGIRAQSPHGDSFKMDCASCHNPSGWTIDRETLTFDHDQTKFKLDGRHLTTDCKACHSSLKFDEASPQCISCHTDVHSSSVGNDCSRCHTTQNWLVDNIPEIHEENGFVLIGAHGSLNCTDCHKSETSLRFDRIGNDCVNCHLSDFQQTKEPDHQQGNFSSNCVECHDPLANNWNSGDFFHDFFPLTQGHAISDCSRCHQTGNFADASPECMSCHMQDYQATTDPNHGTENIATTCNDCHNTAAWVPSTFDHSLFPFVGAHANIANNCSECHHGNYTNTPNTCEGCHMADYNSSTSPNHATGQLPTDCNRCHDETAWVPSTMDHSSFPFVGGHLPVANDCNECHQGNYTNTPNNCEDCHLPDYNNTVSPNHSSAQISTDCNQCHDETAWVPSTMDHSIFPLIGGHAPISNDCNLCHHGNYVSTPNTCEGCHMPDYNNTLSPNHAVSQLPTDCSQCHDETAWIPSTLDHSFYPFVGSHIPIANDCNLCHLGNYVNTPNTCEGCHLPDYTATTSPNHSAAQFPTNCATCHDETAWVPSSFTHNSFPLLGAHASVSDCNDCHHGNYTNTPTACEDCHMPAYNSTTSPNHATSGFPTNCATCHDETAWVPSSFTHNTFPLVGSHASIPNCNDCHNGNFVNTPNTCEGCHMPAYNATTSPSHTAAGFPTNCATCHDETAWVPSSFTHSTYPLVGSHASVPNCNDCHNGNFTNTPNTCEGCHMPAYNATTSPSHTAAGFPVDCATCHDENGWTPSSFNHNSFPLVGSHASVANCNDCHHGNFTNTPSACADCHLPAYNATTSPNHTAAGFPTDCATCHDENGWTPSSFTHSTFPLVGSHASVANCNDCHNGNYTNTPNACEDCHMPAYNATTSPNHTAAGFPTDCATCHDETAWAPSSFNHNIYPLTGGHVGPSCNDCHNGNYTNTPNTCVGCHISDYNATTSPNHIAAQFTTNCTDCHTVNGWTPSTFDHDAAYFPIYTGRHRNEWNNCTDCHTNPNNYSTFSCIDCHEHSNASSLANEHSGVSGYSFNSNACLNCHPNGN